MCATLTVFVRFLCDDKKKNLIQSKLQSLVFRQKKLLKNVQVFISVHILITDSV